MPKPKSHVGIKPIYKALACMIIGVLIFNVALWMNDQVSGKQDSWTGWDSLGAGLLKLLVGGAGIVVLVIGILSFVAILGRGISARNAATMGKKK